MLDRSHEETTSSECVVDNQRHACAVCNLCDLLEIRNIVFRISDTLDINCLCLFVNRSSDILSFVTLNKLCGYPETREEHFELVISSTVEERGGDDVVAGVT